jgi:hypothetical protein
MQLQNVKSAVMLMRPSLGESGGEVRGKLGRARSVNLI